MKTFTIRRILCAVLAALALCASSATAASAHMVGMRGTANRNSLMALDVAGASTAKFAPVIQWWQTGNTNQLWIFDQVTLTSDGHPVYRFQNVNSHQCLTSNGQAGAQVYQYPCQDNDANQQWITELPIVSNVLFAYPIVNRASTLCLDVNGASRSVGAKVITWYCNGNANQRWM